MQNIEVERNALDYAVLFVGPFGGADSSLRGHR